MGEVGLADRVGWMSFCLHIGICNSLFDPGLTLAQRRVIYHEELEGHEGWEWKYS
jgi:hypothetical protein